MILILKSVYNDLRYQNKKDEYIGKFFTVINWDFVNKLLSTKAEKKLNEEKFVNSNIFRIIAESETPKISKEEILEFLKRQ